VRSKNYGNDKNDALQILVATSLAVPSQISAMQLYFEVHIKRQLIDLNHIIYMIINSVSPIRCREILKSYSKIKVADRTRH